MRSSRLFLLLAFILYSFAVNAQIRLQTYTTVTDTFYWKKYIHIPKPPKLSLKQFKVSNSAKIVAFFLAKNLDQYPQFTSDSLPKFTLKELKKSLYPVDINGDKIPDMIFSGNSGGESDIVRIYLNCRDSFKLVFEDYQYITKFRKEAGKLVELQTGDVGSGGNNLYFTRDYRIVQDQDEPVIIRVKQHVAYQYTEEPAQYYPLPIPFTAQADTMLLRASAARLNEPFLPHLDTFGNIVAKYRSKTHGVVLACKTYGKGNDWYFVEIFPDTTPSASILYDLTRMPTFVRGWVSGLSIFPDRK